MAHVGTEGSERSGVAAAALGALIPGLGHGYLGRWQRAGLVFLPLILLAALGYSAYRMQSIDLLAILVRPTVLRGILFANIAVLVWRVFAVADPYRLSQGKHGYSRLLVVVMLSVVVVAPHVLIARYTLDAAQLLDDVFVTAQNTPRSYPVQRAADQRPPFAQGDTALVEVIDPATSEEIYRSDSQRNAIFRDGFGDPDAVANSVGFRQRRDVAPQALAGVDPDDIDRITILLAGGDGGAGRSGQRTDSIIVATFNTKTGKAAAFGIPRNMTHAVLPQEWSTAFVDLEKQLTPWSERRTWTDEDGDGEPDQFVSCLCFPDQINAIYPFTRTWYDTYPDEADPGLAALRDTLEIMLGIKIDYYAMINMNGFVRLVNAIGGVRAYLTSSVVADVSSARELEEWIHVDLRPGWNRLNGEEALAYVRDRKSASDYTRMKRQRCLLKAVAAQTDAATVIRRFSSISRAVGSSVRTDINIDFLPTLLSHAAALDFEDVATVGFVPPFYTPKVDFRGKPTPDMSRIQAMVKWALNAESTTEFATGSESECRI